MVLLVKQATATDGNQLPINALYKIQVKIMSSDLEKLREERNKLIRDAEQAAHHYACQCEFGKEREKAFEIYENIRTSQRVY